MNINITYEMLSPLGNNIQAAFKILHPNGLSIEELAKKSQERNFYRGIYHYVESELKNELRI